MLVNSEQFQWKGKQILWIVFYFLACWEICWNLQNGEAYSERSHKALCCGQPSLEHVRDAGAPTTAHTSERGSGQAEGEHGSPLNSCPCSEAGCLWGGTSTCSGWNRAKQLQISSTWVDIDKDWHTQAHVPWTYTVSHWDIPTTSRRKRTYGHMARVGDTYGPLQYPTHQKSPESCLKHRKIQVVYLTSSYPKCLPGRFFRKKLFWEAHVPLKDE